MDHTIQNELSKAGWSSYSGGYGKCDECGSVVPTLSELILACNPEKADEFSITTEYGEWIAYYGYVGYFHHNEKFRQEDGTYQLAVSRGGTTPEEAVAKLWIALNGK